MSGQPPDGRPPATASPAPPADAKPGSAGAGWTDRKRALSIWVRFVVALSAAMLGTIWARPFTDGLLTEWLAALSAFVLRCGGFDATTAGATVMSSIGAMTIIRECTAVYPTAIFVAAVVAFPSTWPRRALGIVLGIVAIQIVNVVRLLSLLVIAAKYPRAFEMAHLVVWQSLIVLCTIVIWILWVAEIGTPRAKPAA